MLNMLVGKIYTFSTVAPSVLGATIKNAKLLAIMNYDAALAFDNIVLKYRQIYPLLPNGTPDTPESSTYYMFQSESGEKTVLADIWIQDATVVLVDGINFQVLFTSAALADITAVKNQLNAAGYTNFTITQL